MRTRYFTLLVMFLLFAQTIQAQFQVSGELRKWHKITITFDGPNSSETASTNPFSDYRLDVTFTNGSTKYVVPGYYAADGNAANSGAKSGNKWRVHFAPDKTGNWSFNASFRKGSDVAVSDNSNAGSPTSFNGTSGSFNVLASNKGGRDLRGKGRLNYVGKRYLQFAETKEYFIKTGADSPENLLAYEGFDNTTNYKRLLKSWAPHTKDWNSGDPTWSGGKGKGIIGAINYLSEQGQNAFSFLTLSIEGDDRNVFPFISKSSSDQMRYDVSKLDQWEILFEHADQKGMYLHFKTQEKENDQLLNNGALGNTRKLYFRELIARFGHHLALNWNMGEETTISDSERKDYADFFAKNDPYRHNVVIHTAPYDIDRVYSALLGQKSDYTGISIQTDESKVHKDSKTWVENSANSGTPWIVANDETGPSAYGVPPNGYSGKGPNQSQIRGHVLWGNLMAGGAGVEYYFGYSHEESDLTCEDYRPMSNMWQYNRNATKFFHEYLPFWEMKNHNTLIDNVVDGNGKYCFAKPGDIYAIYVRDGSTSFTLDLGKTGQSYEVRWYDPRNGGDLKIGSVKSITGNKREVSLGSPPSDKGNDWVILVRSSGSTTCPAAGTPCNDDDPDTENDKEDGNCNCEGTPIESENPDPAPGPDPELDPDTPDQPELVNIWLEAECALAGSDFTVKSGSGASNDTYLQVTNVSGGLSNPPSSVDGTLTFMFNAPSAGTYRFYVRAIASGDGDDSFYFKVDNGEWITWNKVLSRNYSGSWHWDQAGEWTGNDHAEPLSFDLSAGSHKLTFGSREVGMRIDKIKISTKNNTPSGIGQNAPSCGTVCAPAGTSCNDGNPNTENDKEDGNCNCEGTPIPQCPAKGKSCNDGNPNTENDKEDGNCNCEGTPIPQCPAKGTPCDDGNPNTLNDVEDGDCNCEGVEGNDINIFFEAECADAGSDWIWVDNANASNGAYMKTPAKSSLNAPVTGSDSRLIWNFYLPSDDNFKIFGRVRSSTSGDDSFWVKVDDGEWLRWNRFNLRNDGFAWAQIGDWSNNDALSTPVNFNLKKGNHTLQFTWREPGVMVDKIFITNMGSAPSGLGGDASENCGSPVDECAPAGTSCNDGNPNTENDKEDGNCNCEGTPVPQCPAAGTSCNDGNPNTENDKEDGDCNCEGTPVPQCPAAGISCNDGDPNTENDKEDGNCNCEGTPVPYCPTAGTACNDRNANTINDKEDGNCNCKGTLVSNPTEGDSEGVKIWQEAECLDYVGFTWKVVEDNLASNGYTLRIPPNSDNREGVSGDRRHYIQLKFTVPEAGDYKVFARTITRNKYTDSFWFKVDGSPYELWPLVNNRNYSKDYQWDQLSVLDKSNREKITLPLAAGKHTLRLSIRESDIFVDKFFITNTNLTPSGMGANEGACNASSFLIETSNSLLDNNTFLEEASIRTYPNPTVNKITVEYTLPGNEQNAEGDLMIYDLLGQVVRHEQTLLDKNGRVEMDVSNLPSGSYFLMLISGDQRLQQQFIKAD